MRTPTALRLPLVCLALALPASLAACGGDDDAGGDDDQAAPDADPGAPHAGPDATPGAYDCVGDPFPTSAPATISVGGHTNAISTEGQEPLAGVVVAAHAAAGDALLGMTTSGQDATYAISVTTEGTPVDGYLHATIDTYVDTYVYPPAPLANDLANVPVLLISDFNFGFLPVLAAAPQDNVMNGFVGILVVDCFGAPVQGATVTVEGADAANVRYPQDGSVPNNSNGATDASGIALIFDVPPGDTITVDASAAGHEFAEHDIEVRIGVITTTVVAPGPITDLQP